jgi:hypothetical protein
MFRGKFISGSHQKIVFATDTNVAILMFRNLFNWCIRLFAVWSGPGLPRSNAVGPICWFWFILPKNHFTEKNLRTPFHRNTIWPNAIWPKSYFTEKSHLTERNCRSFHRKNKEKGHLTETQNWKMSHLTENSFNWKVIWPAAFSINGHLTERLFEEVVLVKRILLKFFFGQMTFRWNKLSVDRCSANWLLVQMAFGQIYSVKWFSVKWTRTFKIYSIDTFACLLFEAAQICQIEYSRTDLLYAAACRFDGFVHWYVCISLWCWFA